MSDDPTGPVPWWRDGKWVTTLTAIVSLVTGVVTTVDTIEDNKAEREMKRAEQLNARRVAWVDRALSTTLSEGEQRRVLRLIRALKTEDGELSAWAEGELTDVEKRVAELEKERDALVAERTALEKDLEKAKLASTTDRATLGLLKAQIEEKTEAAARVDARLGAPQQVADAHWFAVVASERSLEEARKDASTSPIASAPWMPEVHAATDEKGKRVWAVTLGATSSAEEARHRVRWAREQGVASDAYVWHSDRWGPDLLAADGTN
ncbi:MAG: hypothetical protein ACOZNI_27230 [Myxococcota bacterium]